jgi:hypothetical protein
MLERPSKPKRNAPGYEFNFERSIRKAEQQEQIGRIQSMVNNGGSYQVG